MCVGKIDKVTFGGTKNLNFQLYCCGCSNQRCLKAEVLSRAIKFAYIGINEKQALSRAIIQVRWISPSMNWYKLNSDGSSLGNSGLAGRGGLVRDDKGYWIKGYTRAIGITTNVAAEL